MFSTVSNTYSATFSSRFSSTVLPTVNFLPIFPFDSPGIKTSERSSRLINLYLENQLRILEFDLHFLVFLYILIFGHVSPLSGTYTGTSPPTLSGETAILVAAPLLFSHNWYGMSPAAGWHFFVFTLVILDTIEDTVEEIFVFGHASLLSEIHSVWIRYGVSPAAG